MGGMQGDGQRPANIAQTVNQAPYTHNPDLPSTVPKEANFARLPFARMSWNKTSEPLVYTYDAYDADGNKRTAKWVVGVESSGNITPFDGKVFSAFHAYAGEVREREGSLPKVLPVSVNRLGQLLGYTSMRGYDSSPGSAYGNIKSSLRRIGAVRCSSTQAYWSIEEESWLTIDFNIFTSVVFRGQRIGRKGRTIEKC